MPNASPDLPDPYAWAESVLKKTDAQKDDPYAWAAAQIQAAKPQSIKVKEESSARDAHYINRNIDGILTRQGLAKRDLYLPEDDPAWGDDEIRQYLHTYTSGNLDLTQHPTAPSGHNLALNFAATNPAAYGTLVNHPSLNNLLRTANNLNNTPETPRETLDSIRDAAAMWTAVSQAGKLIDTRAAAPAAGPVGAGAGGPSSQARPFTVPSGISPDLIQQTFSKVLAADISNPYKNNSSYIARLDRDGPLGDERAAFDALGGWNFVAFLQRHSPYFTAKRRWESFFGRPITQDFLKDGTLNFNQVYVLRNVHERRRSDDITFRNLAVAGGAGDPIPTPEQAFTPDLLYEVSPYMRHAVEAGVTEAAGAAESEAAHAVQRRAYMRQFGIAFGGPLIGGAVGEYLAPLSTDESRDRLYASTIKRSGGAFDLATAGLISEGVRSLDKGMEEIGIKDAWTTFIGKTAANVLGIGRRAPGVSRQFELHEQIQQMFPEMSREDREDLYHQRYNMINAVDDLLFSMKERGGIPELLVKSAHLHTPEMRRLFSEAAGGTVDNPAELTMIATTAGAAATAKWTQTGRLLRAVGREPTFAARLGVYGSMGRKGKLPASLFKGVDEAAIGPVGHPGWTALSAENQGAIIGRFVSRLRSEISPQNLYAAKGLVNELRRFIKRSELPLDPHAEGWLNHAVDNVARDLKKARRLRGDARSTQLDKVFEGTGKVAGALGFDSNVVLRGGRLNLNPNIIGLKATKTWLDTMRRSATDTPEIALRALGEDKVKAINEGVMLEASRVSDNAAKAARMDEILTDLQSVVDHQQRAYSAQGARTLNQLERTADGYNRLVGEQLDQSWNIAHRGDHVLEPNPVTNSRLYSRVDSALTDKSGASLRELLWSKQGNPNRRIAQRIGGEELARTLNTLRDTEIRLANEATKGRATAADALRVRREAESLFRSHLERWHEQASTPIRRRIKPQTVDQLPATAALRDSITAKLDSARRTGEVVDLTPTELKWLNENRRAGYRLGSRNDAYRATRPLRDEITKNQKMLDGLEEFQNELAAARKNLQDPRVLAPKNTTILDLSPNLRDQIVSYLDSAEARHFFDTHRTYTSINRLADKRELTGLQAWREASERTASNLAAMENGIIRITAEMAKHLPLESRFLLLREGTIKANGLHDHLASETKRFANQYGKLPDEDKAAIYSAMQEGNPTGLTKPTKHAYDLALNLRRSMLDMLNESGVITPEQYRAWYAEDYVHNTYMPRDHKTRTPSKPPPVLPKRFTPLSTEASPLKFRRPEDKHWVSWRDEGKIQHKKGFDSPDDAAAFLETLPARVTEANIHAPVPRWQKLVEGLIPEAGYATMKMSENLITAINNARISKVVAEAGLAPTYEDLVSFGAEINVPRGEAWAGGRHYIRADHAGVPILRGRWVDSQVFKHLNDFSKEVTWLRDLSDAVTKAANKAELSPDTGRILSAMQAVAKKIPGASRALSTSLSLSKILAGPPAYLAGWLGNATLYSRAAFSGVVNLATDLGTLPRHLYECLAEHRKIATGKMRLEDSPTWYDLKTGDHVREWDRHSFHDELESHFKKNVESAAGVENRIRAAEAELVKAIDSGDAKAAGAIHTHIDDLRDQAEALGKEALKDTFTHIGVNWKRWTTPIKGLWNTLQGRSKLNQIMWNFYSWASGDVFYKYHIHKTLVEHAGLTREEASARLSAYTQHMHRLSNTWRENMSSVTGAFMAGFRADQFRIWNNVAQHNRALVAKSMLALSGYNTSMLYAHGIDPQDYIDNYAMQNGLEHNKTLAGILAMTAGVQIPGAVHGEGTPYVMPLGRALGYDIVAQGNPRTQEMVDRWTAGSGGLTKTLANGAASVVQGTVFGSVAMQALQNIAAGKDDKGDPINSLGDATAMVARTALLPSFAPGGYHFQKIKRATQTSVPPKDRTGPAEISPSTLKGINAHDQISRSLLKSRPSMDARQFLQAAAYSWMEKQGLRTTFIADQPFNERHSTRMARHAGFGDGTMDKAILKAENEQWYRDNPEFGALPSGELREVPVDPRTKKEALERAKMGTFRARINNAFRVDKMMMIYMYWRKFAGTGDNFSAEDDTWFKADVSKKIMNAPIFQAEARFMAENLKEWEQDADIPDDAKRVARAWVQKAAERAVDAR